MFTTSTVTYELARQHRQSRLDEAGRRRLVRRSQRPVVPASSVVRLSLPGPAGLTSNRARAA